MAKESKYSIRDLERDFPDDGACLDLIFDSLHSRTCSCGGTYAPLFRWKEDAKKKLVKTRQKQFQCSKCRFQIAPTAGTIFHKSDTPLSLWFHAIFVFSNAKSGISAKEMERQLGVTYKCAWRILSLIRKALKQDRTRLRGEVEIDTGFFGGKGNAGRNNEGLGEVMKRKAVVTIAIERGGNMKAEVMPDATAETMRDFLSRNVHTNISRIMTDSSRVYQKADWRYHREAVDHHRGEYARGNVHVNAVETFFAHLKRSIKGTYKTLSRKHLQSYLDAFAFHYNNRHSDRQRFGALMGSVLLASR